MFPLSRFLIATKNSGKEKPETWVIPAESGGFNMFNCVLSLRARSKEQNSLGNTFPVTSRLDFFKEAISTLSILVVALGAGLGVWGVVNLLEGYGNDNPGAKSQGIKHFIPK